MLTRRSFVALSSVVREAGAFVPSTSAIGKLRSRRSEVRPITAEERQQRIARAQKLMVENAMQATLLMGGTSLAYFTGVRWWNSERLFAAVIPARGEPFVVCPAFEEERAREQLAAGLGATHAEVHVWDEDVDPYKVAADALKQHGMATGTIGIEETVRFVFADGLARALPAAKLISATPVTAGCRMIKSPAELALMRLASSVTLQAYQAAWQSVREGMTDRELRALIGTAFQALGFSGEASVQTGKYTALPHGSAQPQTIVEGSIVLIDDGSEVEGYQSDITRTLVLGKPADSMRKVFDIVRKAQSAALAACRPGVSCETVDIAARKIVADAGYGPDYKFFRHRVGHGIGMDGHEWPYLVRGNKLRLAPGMTFSNEPGIYLPGQFGVRLEDDMVITDNGAELLTPPSRSLERPFG